MRTEVGVRGWSHGHVERTRCWNPIADSVQIVGQIETCILDTRHEQLTAPLGYTRHTLTIFQSESESPCEAMATFKFMNAPPPPVLPGLTLFGLRSLRSQLEQVYMQSAAHCDRIWTADSRNRSDRERSGA